MAATRFLSRLAWGAGLVFAVAASGGAAPRHRGSLHPAHHVRFHRILPVRTIRAHRLSPARLQLTNISGPPSRPVPPPKPLIPTAADLYQRSLDADDRFSYRGRQNITYWHNGRSIAIIISHLAPSRRRIDYLAPDAERGRVLVTDRKQEWQFSPSRRQMLWRRLDPGAEALSDAAESYDLLRTNYLVAVLPEKRSSAERKVFLVTMTRRSLHTLARKLWIDAATGLVLKRESYREDGKLALTAAFSDISFHPHMTARDFDLAPVAKRLNIRPVFEPDTDPEVSIPLAAAASGSYGPFRAPQTLAGYRLVGASRLRTGRISRLHLRYSDGLVLISLFEQKRTQLRRPTAVPRSLHPLQIGRQTGHFARHSSLGVLNWDSGSLNLTLMGEPSQASLIALARVLNGGV